MNYLADHRNAQSMQDLKRILARISVCDQTCQNTIRYYWYIGSMAAERKHAQEVWPRTSGLDAEAGFGGGIYQQPLPIFQYNLPGVLRHDTQDAVLHSKRKPDPVIRNQWIGFGN